MRWIASLLLLSILWPMAAAAENPIPDRRFVVTRDIDFYGSDLQTLFDTSYEACQRACLADDSCQAFTFNSRSGACFPKSEISDRQPYDGAISAEIYTADPGVRAAAETRAAELEFLSASDIRRATALAADIGDLHNAGKWTVDAMLQAARDRAATGDAINAMRWAGAAVSKSDASDLWLDYAQRNLALKPSNQSDLNRYRGRALSASVNAYLRAMTGPARVSALSVMAEALEVTKRGRDTIPALRLAQSIQPRQELAARLDDAIGKYGFRIAEHSVESESAAPRICAQFSEPLVESGTDYAPYVRLPDQRLVVQAEKQKICIDGVAHGQRYVITFREGLPAASGEELAKDIELTLYVRDRSPAARFPGRAYVLPKSADAGLPIETVNLDRVALVLRRVSDRNLLRAMQENFFGRPLSHWEKELFAGEIAEDVWTGQGDVQNELNRDMTTRLPIGEVIADLPPGIYAMTASVEGADPYDDPGATQWFVLTDLGVSTLSGADGLHVFVRALTDASARAGVEVTLVSRANRVLGRATTNADGHARFDPGLSRGTGGAEPALVLVEDGDTDMAFLSLADPAFDLSDRGVAGRSAAPPVDVFLATDRGAYRAGETLHVTALARTGLAEAIPGLPLTAILTRPDGVEYTRQLSTDDIAGGHVFTLPLAASVPRGTWRLQIKSDPKAAPLADRLLLVEDFLPERIDFDLSLPDAPIRATDAPELTVAARYLFGAPAGDLPVEGEVTVRARTSLPGFPDYRFGRHDRAFSPRTAYFGGARTDAQGVARQVIDLPEFDDPGRPLEAEVSIQVSEGSGRPVERQLRRDLAPSAPMIGIKPLFDDVAAEGSDALLEVLALGPDLTPVDMDVRWTVNRVETRYQWYQLYGQWNWEATTTRRRVANGEARLGAAPAEVSAPVEWGRYELVVEQVGGGEATASTAFYAGWYAPADVSSTPDTLALSLDKPGYRSGDTAQLRIVPRYAGTAVVQVLSNRLVAMKTVEVGKGETVIDLPVTDEWGAGAYVTATVIRPMDVSAGMNPARSLGLAYAKIDPGARQLEVAVDAPDKSGPRAPLEATLQVAGAKPGETVYATVAAVDLGILNLTGFASPDPSAHYFGQRRLGVDMRDLYGRLIDGQNGAMGALRSGGDSGPQVRTEAPPPTEDLVAFFTGPVEVGTDGRATVSFDIPEFNGTVRLMAVAWSAGAVGQAERDVLVRDPVVVTASLPRFLAPGDQSSLLLEIVHADGPAGRMGLDVSAEGLALGKAIPPGFDLDEKAKATFRIPITAGEVGDHSLRVALTTPDGRQLVKSLGLGVRANDPVVAQTRRFQLDPGGTFRADTDLFAAMRPGTASAILTGGPLAKFDAPGLLSALDRYPYGCTEQVTSRAMPLLYFGAVAKALDLGERDRIDQRVSQAIDRVLTRQDTNGAFGLWYPQSGDFWLDAYVSDFLSRARARGHAVPDIAFRAAMDNLRNRLNYAPDFDKGGEDIAYALMVLAREGAAAMADLRYYADVKADAFTTPLGAAQLGAALAMYGDQTRADAMFTRAMRLIMPRLAGSETPVWRTDYGTDLRDAAAVLTLAVEAGSMAVDSDALADRITAPGRTLSTQESVWSLLAAHALIGDGQRAALTVNGLAHPDPLIRLDGSGMSTRPLAIGNPDTRATDITLTTFGVPLVAPDKGGYGLDITRRYFTPEGTQVALDTVSAGDRLIAVLQVTPFEAGAARLIIDDPLPAGFEIDNPNLLRSGDLRDLGWLTLDTARHTEFRADRFIAAIDWRQPKPLTLAYTVRAISPGTYHHPAASVEDMYRPQYRARSATGRLIVSE